MHIKKISAVLLLAISVAATTGCLKDKDFERGRFGFKDVQQSAVGVGFPQASNTVNVTGIELRSASQDLEIALVNLLSDEPAEKDVHVTLQLNPGLVTAYNTNNNPDLEMLPQNSYTLPSLTLTIPKGERTGTLAMTIPNSTVLNPSRRYGIGFTIASVQEGDVVIAENMKHVLFAITLRNAYEGQYEIAVDLTGHPSASGHYEETRTLTTVDANTLDAPLAVALIFASTSRLEIRINPDNSLSLSSNATTINPLTPGTNYYDPATRTFHFDYTWGAGPRHIVGTATRL